MAWFVRSWVDVRPEIANGLRSTLFRRMSSIVAGAGASLTLMLTAASRHPGGAFLAWAITGCSLETVRLLNIAVIRRAIVRRTLRDTSLTVDLLVGCSLLWSLLLGLGCLLCLLSNDGSITIFSLVMGVGVMGGIASRNPGSPRLSVAMMALILLPMTLGLHLTSQTGLRPLAMVVPLYLFGMWSIIRQLHDDYVAMLTAQWENRHRALHCSLTGLPNVRCFHEMLTDAIAVCGLQPIAVLALDLDGFKAVNDRFGHPVGDDLLKAVTDRIRSVESPTIQAARIGGDEFAVVLQNRDAQVATAIAEHLIALISKPYRLNDVVAEVGVSIGIALSGPETATSGVLHARADKALYRAKAVRKGGWWIDVDEGRQETCPLASAPEDQKVGLERGRRDPASATGFARTDAAA